MSRDVEHLDHDRGHRILRLECKVGRWCSTSTWMAGRWVRCSYDPGNWHEGYLTEGSPHTKVG